MSHSHKHAFGVPPEIAYFNCAYMAPMLHAVRKAGEDAIQRTTRSWELTARDFFVHSERARELFARLINARADDVAIVPSVSYGVEIAARNLAIGQGQSILVLEEQFPSNVYPWQALAKRTGAALKTVPRPLDGDWTAAILQSLDPRVAIAALPNCHWTDGSYIDLARVSAALQDIGARLVLDVTQSLGALPLDTSAIKVDFLACASYKWLLGPYSVAFLYVAEEHHTSEPLEHNWIVRERSEDFSMLVDYRDGYQPGARRFDMGERANFILLPMVCAAMEQLLAWTPAFIADTLSEMTESIAGKALELGLLVAPRQLRAGHLLGLRFRDGCPPMLVERFKRKNIFVSIRGDTMRIAPHLCCDQSDVERLLEELEAASPR